MKETKKIKVEPNHNPQNSLFFAQKIPLNKIKSKARIEGDIENICCSAIFVDLKHILNHNSNLIKDQYLP